MDVMKEYQCPRCRRRWVDSAGTPGDLFPAFVEDTKIIYGAERRFICSTCDERVQSELNTTKVVLKLHKARGDLRRWWNDFVGGV